MFWPRRVAKSVELEGLDEGHVRCWRWVIEGVYGDGRDVE
jgi:hypothetical protein